MIIRDVHFLGLDSELPSNETDIGAVILSIKELAVGFEISGGE